MADATFTDVRTRRQLALIGGALVLLGALLGVLWGWATWTYTGYYDGGGWEYSGHEELGNIAYVALVAGGFAALSGILLLLVALAGLLKGGLLGCVIALIGFVIVLAASGLQSYRPGPHGNFWSEFDLFLLMGCMALAVLSLVLTATGGAVAISRAAAHRKASHPPPAWYRDPAGSSALRWWDGHHWTDAIVESPDVPRSGAEAR